VHKPNEGKPSLYRDVERLRSSRVNSDPTTGDAYLGSKLMSVALKGMSH